MDPNPLKNGLFVRRTFSNAVLRGWNWALSWKKEKKPIPKNPKKILLCNIANLGDVVISTTVLPPLKKHYPDCEIAFLTSSASAIVLNKHPLISKVHTFDHWYLHKCKAALQTRKVVQELKQAKYDLAIDLYGYFPNAIPLLAKTKIPVRIGYPTGGFSSLLTHPATWNFPNQYTGVAHLHLLQVLGINVDEESPLPSYSFKKKRKSYIAIHMGSADPIKEWPESSWLQLIQHLESSYEIILTGKGEREGKVCDRIANQTTAKNMSNQLNWKEFVHKIQEARLLISVDSVAIHLAAGTLTPTVAIFTGINRSQMWSPPHAYFKRITKTVPCSPCFRKAGCPTLLCIKGIAVEDVYQAATELLLSEYFSIKPLAYPQNTPI